MGIVTSRRHQFKMITVKNIGYNGRLGNQLFQFAAAFGLAKSKGLNPSFPIENTRVKSPHDGYWCDLNNLFNLEPFFNTTVSECASVPVYNEPVFHYTPISHLGDHVSLNGYFQSEKYFENCATDLRDALQFKESVKETCDPAVSQLEAKASLHVRRGDYVNQPQNHPSCSLEYYRSGLEQVAPGGRVIVFSDDIEWCKRMLTPIAGDKELLFAEGGTPYTDFYIMSQCETNIIANSTFSWWAAWLNNHPTKKVIAPSNWFGPNLASNDTKDLIPQSWIVL